MSKLAIILIRGFIGMKKEVKDTFFMLGLRKKLSCAVLEDTPVARGMLKKCKDFSTFGVLSEDVEKMLKNNIVHLHPPRGGFERKGIKTPFVSGGALGDRKEKINDLIKRMIP